MVKALRMAVARSVDDDDDDAPEEGARAPVLLLPRLLLLFRLADIDADADGGANDASESKGAPLAAAAALYLPSMSRTSCSSRPWYRCKKASTLPRLAALCFW